MLHSLALLFAIHPWGLMAIQDPTPPPVIPATGGTASTSTTGVNSTVDSAKQIYLRKLNARKVALDADPNASVDQLNADLVLAESEWKRKWTAAIALIGTGSTDPNATAQATALNMMKREVEIAKVTAKLDDALRDGRNAGTDETKKTAADDAEAAARAELAALSTEHATEDTEAKTRGEKVAKEEKEALQFKRSAAFSWELIGGVQLSQENGRFSELNEFIRFSGSERFGSPKDDSNGNLGLFGGHGWDRCYSAFGVELSALPTSSEDDDDFSAVEKAATLDLTVEYRLAQWVSSEDGSTGFITSLYRQSVSAFTRDPTEEGGEPIDSVNGGYGIGFRIGEHAGATAEDRNPLLYRYLLVTFGDQGQLGDRVVTFEGQLRFGTRADTGLFMGVRTTMGGDDDEDSFSILFGINDVVGFLSPIFDKLGDTFSGE